MGNDSEIWEKIHAMTSVPNAVSTILNSMRSHALTQISKADGIVLCGATPFARAASKQEIWRGRKIEIEDFENGQLSIRGGQKLYVLCSRPNVEKHMRILAGQKNVIQWQEILCAFPELSCDPYAYRYEKVVESVRDVVNYLSDYEAIYHDMADEISRCIFSRMILFRLTYDVHLHGGLATKYPHYFDADVVNLGDKEIFVDCGGYSGDTLDEFMRQTRGIFEEYYLFEPDGKLIKRARHIGDSRIHYIQKGVWSNDKILKFRVETASGNGTMVMLTNDTQGLEDVPVCKLDSVVEQASFIKMDVEGAELQALEGAKQLIERCHPVLAICTYHKLEDYRVLYRLIKKMGNYRFYLRAQYNNIDTETYYLCVPRE